MAEIGERLATVSLAEDVKHNRKVTVKVLKPELAAALGHERFLADRVPLSGTPQGRSAIRCTAATNGPPLV
jgi:hypothetical protein